MDSNDAELVAVWDRPGLSWEIRTMLDPALKNFENDITKTKPKNLEALLSRLDQTSREHIETLTLKKPSSFYDKFLAALTSERELIASRTQVKRDPDADFEAIAAGFEASNPIGSREDDMDLAAYSAPAEGDEYEDASRFVDDLLQGIRAGRK